MSAPTQHASTAISRAGRHPGDESSLACRLHPGRLASIHDQVPIVINGHDIVDVTDLTERITVDRSQVGASTLSETAREPAEAARICGDSRHRVECSSESKRASRASTIDVTAWT
jgi:hypothetical protein